MKLTREEIKVLAEARRVAVLTGSGISAESGIPTFRGENGIWTKLNPEELANFNAFLKNPELVSAWYSHRREIIRESKPNAAHLALAELEGMYEDFTLITQNIDNLHQRAGSRNVCELHGNIERNYCINCGTRYDGEDFEENDSFHCRKCGGLIRPDIVWFGEMLPHHEWEKSEQAAGRSDVMYVIGTSAVVYPAAQLPLIAKRNGSFIVEINIEPTPVSEYADISIYESSASAMPELLKLIKEYKRVEEV